MNSAHFKQSELACSHCGETKSSTELLAVLQLVRIHFNQPVTVTSGYRCKEHNKAVGGAKYSKHIFGIAADIKVKGVEPGEVYHLLDSLFPEYYGIGLYNRPNGGWVHIDTRQDKARWDG